MYWLQAPLTCLSPASPPFRATFFDPLSSLSWSLEKSTSDVILYMYQSKIMSRVERAWFAKRGRHFVGYIFMPLLVPAMTSSSDELGPLFLRPFYRSGNSFGYEFSTTEVFYRETWTNWNSSFKIRAKIKLKMFFSAVSVSQASLLLSAMRAYRKSASVRLFYC